MYDNTAGILKCRGSGVQNTCRIFSSYHSGVENTCRIFMQYPSVVQNTCRIVISHLSAVRNTAVLSQLRRVPGCRGRNSIRPTDGPAEPNDGRVMGGFWGRRLGIRPCFSNRVHVSVGDMAMFSKPDTRYPLKYGHVFRTGYMFRLGIRACFRHLRVAFVGRMQYAPTRVTCRTSKYGRVFRRGYT